MQSEHGAVDGRYEADSNVHLSHTAFVLLTLLQTLHNTNAF